MLTWLDGRNQSSFGSISWAGGELQFTISPGSGATGLRAMVPDSASNGELESIKRGATTVPLTDPDDQGRRLRLLRRDGRQLHGDLLEHRAAQPPSLTGTIPPSPANDNSPKVTGSAAAGTTVKIYCRIELPGAPVATGTAAQLATGISASVADNSTTTFRATATLVRSGLQLLGPDHLCGGLAAPDHLDHPESRRDRRVRRQPNSNSAATTAPGLGRGVASSAGSTRPSGGLGEPAPRRRAYSALADGSHKFEVRAIDQAGNVDADPGELHLDRRHHRADHLDRLRARRR